MFWELGNSKRGLEFLEDPEQFNSYSYARNNPILYTDPSGESVELVSRKLNMTLGDVGVHTYIRITETTLLYTESWQIDDAYGLKPKVTITTIGGYKDGDKLVNRINDSSDSNQDNYKIKMTLEPPKGMSEKEFIQALLKANENYKGDRTYRALGDNGGYNGNCNNFTATILKESGYDLKNLKNFDPTGANPGLGQEFKEPKKGLKIEPKKDGTTKVKIKYFIVN